MFDWVLMSNTVALLAGAETARGGVWDSAADEVWSMNWNYLYDWVPRIDRLFEMHPIWVTGSIEKPEYDKPRKHWAWLQNTQTDYPIYMLQYLPSVPSCVPFSIVSVSKLLFGDLLVKGDSPHDFYTSTVDYMLALAIYEHAKFGRWETIELYGAEMGSGTEYRYQREGAAFFIGQAIARGIKVVRASNSILLRTKKYGYEGGQMIFRQDLERLLGHWKREKRDYFARVANLEGRLQNMAKDGPVEDEEFQHLAIEYQNTKDTAAVAAGYVQCLEYLIKEIDMEETNLDLTNPFEQIKLNVSITPLPDEQEQDPNSKEEEEQSLTPLPITDANNKEQPEEEEKDLSTSRS